MERKGSSSYVCSFAMLKPVDHGMGTPQRMHEFFHSTGLSQHIGGTVTDIGMHNFWNINANGPSLLQAQIAAWFVKSQCMYDFWSLNCGEKRCSNHCMRNKALCISPSKSDWYMHNLTNEHSAYLLHTPSRVLDSSLAGWMCSTDHPKVFEYDGKACTQCWNTVGMHTSSADSFQKCTHGSAGIQ